MDKSKNLLRYLELVEKMNQFSQKELDDEFNLEVEAVFDELDHLWYKLLSKEEIEELNEKR